MSDITPAKEKIQQESVEFEASTSEFAMKIMGGTINWILNKIDTDLSNYSLKIQTFTSSGNFTTPADVLFLLLQGIGGGAGGWNNNSGSCYAGGAARSRILLRDVTPSTLYNIIIGSGGSASDIFGNPPGINYPGASTYFDTNKFTGGSGRSNNGSGLGNGLSVYEYAGGTQIITSATIGGGDASDFGAGGTLGGNGQGYGSGGSGTGNGASGLLKIVYFTKY